MIEDRLNVAKRNMVITQIMSISDDSKCELKGCNKHDKIQYFHW